MSILALIKKVIRILGCFDRVTYSNQVTELYKIIIYSDQVTGLYKIITYAN